VPTERRSAVGRLLRQRELGLVVALAIVCVAFETQNGNFLSGSYLQDIALSTAILMIAAAGQTLVVVSRNIDLSVGSMLGLGGFVAANALKHHDLALPLVFALGAGVGLLLGAVNATLVAYLSVPSIVATLGTLYVFRGIDFLLGGDGRQVNADDVPASFLALANDKLLGIPVMFLAALAIVAAVGWALRNARWGRSLYAIGSNPAGARPAGIPVRRMLFVAFCVSGLLAGLAGVMWGSIYAGIDPQAGRGFELTVVAAVVVGGVNIFGGAGTVWGAALGALLLTAIQSGLSLVQISPFWLEAIYGAAIVLAVLLDARLNARLTARELARSAA